MPAFYHITDPAYVPESWQASAPFTVTVDTTRRATLLIPADTSVFDYEYTFRPAPTVSTVREVDMSRFLAFGENPTDYEFQLRF